MLFQWMNIYSTEWILNYFLFIPLLISIRVITSFLSKMLYCVDVLAWFCNISAEYISIIKIVLFFKTKGYLHLHSTDSASIPSKKFLPVSLYPYHLWASLIFSIFISLISKNYMSLINSYVYFIAFTFSLKWCALPFPAFFSYVCP